jgi:hypothetical protein
MHKQLTFEQRHCINFNALAVDDNSEQPNKEELNKEAYLDLSKPYTHKWCQAQISAEWF